MDVIASPSPNFNARKRPVSLIILHYTGMRDGPAALARMCDPEAQVSAHYMVEEDGRIFQLVDEADRAWHAGVSTWNGEQDINSASIGVEIVNGGHDFGLPEFPPSQITQVITLVQALRARWSIPPENVIGHSDIAPDRKADPGERFPWRQLAQAGCAASLPETRREGDALQLLQQIGYALEPEPVSTVRAFQRRWRPEGVSGALDKQTCELIARVASLA